jgi:hypothetical protein
MPNPHHTSPGGRVFGFILALVLIPLGLFAAYYALNIFTAGHASFTVRRGRGRVLLDGWRAYVYATGMLSLAFNFLAMGAAGAMATFLPQRMHRYASLLLSAGLISFYFTGAAAVIVAFAAILK